MRNVILFSALVSLCAVGLSNSHAEDVTEITASGRAAGTDSAARAKAVDAAFAVAIRRALVGMLPRDVVRERRIQLDQDVVRHARRYITSFAVQSEDRNAGETRVSLSASVDKDRIRDALGDLGIGTGSSSAQESRKPRIVVLAKASGPEETTVTFGESADSQNPMAKAIEKELQGQGFDVVWTRGQVPISREGRNDVPVQKDSAIEVAREAGAGAVLIAGLYVEDEGVIRGTTHSGSRGVASVLLADVETGDVLADTSVESAGYGETVGQAYAEARAGLVSGAFEKLGGAIQAHWPSAGSGGPEVTVRFVGLTRLEYVSRVIRKLAMVRGIERVGVVFSAAGQTELRVVGRLLQQDISQEIAATRWSGGDILSRVTGDVVDVTFREISGASFEPAQ